MGYVRLSGLLCLAGGVSVVILGRDTTRSHERVPAGICKRGAIALRVLLRSRNRKHTGRQLLAGFVDEDGFYADPAVVRMLLLNQRDSVAVQAINDGFHARSKVSISALKVRVAGGLQRWAEGFLCLYQCGADLLLFH